MVLLRRRNFPIGLYYFHLVTPAVCSLCVIRTRFISDIIFTHLMPPMDNTWVFCYSVDKLVIIDAAVYGSCWENGLSRQMAQVETPKSNREPPTLTMLKNVDARPPCVDDFGQIHSGLHANGMIGRTQHDPPTRLCCLGCRPSCVRQHFGQVQLRIVSTVFLVVSET